MAYRWRHIMWLLPLAGLITAAAIEWRKYQRSLQPSGEIEIASRPSLASIPRFAGRFPALTFTEVQGIALSDEVLAAACEHAGLTGKGTPLEKCIADLRSKVEITLLPGTSTVLVSVRGKPSWQTRVMAEGVIRKTVWYTEKTERAERNELLEKPRQDLTRLDDSFTDRLTELARLDNTEGVDQELIRKGRNELLRERHADGSGYSRLSTQLLSAERFHSQDKGPLLVKRWPSTSLPRPSTWQRVQEVLPTILTGTGSGILATVALAYLLEALRPTKQKRRLEEGVA